MLMHCSLWIHTMEAETLAFSHHCETMGAPRLIPSDLWTVGTNRAALTFLTWHPRCLDLWPWPRCRVQPIDTPPAAAALRFLLLHRARGTSLKHKVITDSSVYVQDPNVLWGPVHTGRIYNTLQQANAKNRTHCCQWSVHIALQATSKDFQANLMAILSMRPVWMGPEVSGPTERTTGGSSQGMGKRTCTESACMRIQEGWSGNSQFCKPEGKKESENGTGNTYPSIKHWFQGPAQILLATMCITVWTGPRRTSGFRSRWGAAVADSTQVLLVMVLSSVSWHLYKIFCSYFTKWQGQMAPTMQCARPCWNLTREMLWIWYNFWGQNNASQNASR